MRDFIHFTSRDLYLNSCVSVGNVWSVEPHPNADRLDVVKVSDLGATWVVNKGYLKKGDYVMLVYEGPAIPTEEGQWGYEYRRKLRNGHYVKGYSIRGVWSHGLCIKIDDLPIIKNGSVSDFEKDVLWRSNTLSLCARLAIVAPFM